MIEPILWPKSSSKKLVFASALLVLPVILSLTSLAANSSPPSTSASSSSSSSGGGSSRFLLGTTTNPGVSFLQYDFYSDNCPQAEDIVRSTVKAFLSTNRNVTAQLLRLLFHDCFIQGCDASILLDDSSGNKNHSIERQAIPNKTLRGFNVIDAIKEELENTCPAVVSCADIISLATRDGILLTGGPFYPVFTGRRDSNQSFFARAMAEIPRPDGNISETLRLFALRGFDERETVSLLGAHNIGKISCEFINPRLANFRGTGRPDPSVPSDFLKEMRLACEEGIETTDNATLRSKRRMLSNTRGMAYSQALFSSVISGSGFDAHYYRSLLRGRGLLFADQQLMTNDKTAELVREYASDDGSTFRKDFGRAMVKLSALDVLTGSEGQIRINCSMPLTASSS